MRLAASIEEVGAIDFLDDLATAYRRRHGRAPILLSHWDPTERFARTLGKAMTLPAFGEPFRYRYSFQSDVRDGVLRKLGYSEPERRILLTENGTNAVLAVANTLSLLGVRRVALLSPSYFATAYALERFGITIRRIYWPRVAGAFHTPEITLDDGEALWAESPIFGTGVSADDLLREVLSTLAGEDRLVVFDRSLEEDAGPLGAELQRSPHFLSVHAPHKTVCVNGLKFGAATFHAKLYDTFDHWADVLSGGLSLSAEAASRHFVTPAFDCYAETVALHVASANKAIRRLGKQFAGAIEIDEADVGYWRTVYAPGVSAALGREREWLADLLERTGGIPIPGTWTGCSSQWGFCFRLNLLRYDVAFRGALHRVLTVLAESSAGPPRP